MHEISEAVVLWVETLFFQADYSDSCSEENSVSYRNLLLVNARGLRCEKPEEPSLFVDDR